MATTVVAQECSNCTSMISTPNDNCFSTVDEEGCESQVGNPQAFATVFEHGIQLGQQERFTGAPDLGSLKLCLQCTSMLGELYKCYTGFIKLTRQASHVQKLIRCSQLWEYCEVHPMEIKPVLTVEVDLGMMIQEGDKGAAVAQLKVESFESRPSREASADFSDDDWFLESGVMEPSPSHLRNEDMKVGSVKHAAARGSRRRSYLQLDPATNQYSCTICQKHFASLVNLQKHDALDHKQIVVCDKKFPLKKKRTASKSSAKTKTKPLSKIKTETHHRGTSPSKCKKPKTGESTDAVDASTEPEPASASSPNPKQPMRWRHRLCPDCGMEFFDRDKYKYHRLCKHPSQIFPCTQPNCTKTFVLEAKLNWHLVIAHGIGQRLKELECPVEPCTKYFATPSELKEHLKLVHHDESAQISCSFCPRKFPTQGRLNTHVREIHEGRKYPCRFCDKILSTTSMRTTHVRDVHGEGGQGGPPLVTCPICGKSSNKSGYLNKHMISHEVKGQFQCDQCPKIFTHSHYLKRHLRGAHSKKTFTCMECELTFTNSTKLRKHINLTHNNFLHVCKLCGKGFKLRDYLRAHMASKTHGGPGSGSTALYKQKKQLLLEASGTSADAGCGPELQKQF